MIAEHSVAWTAGRWRCCITALITPSPPTLTLQIEIPRELMHDGTDAERQAYATGRDIALETIADRLALLIDAAARGELADTPVH